jgi:hypothetical protein
MLCRPAHSGADEQCVKSDVRERVLNLPDVRPCQRATEHASCDVAAIGPQWRTEMTNRFAVWDEITVAAAA